MYAILDIETGGGAYNHERIIEIAIYRFDGEEVVDNVSALINPETGIDYYVSKLTGITDAMVKRAPKFHEMAKRIVEITEGCVLVAHNAPSDYRIIRNEFKRLGYDYQRSILDTFPLSQELIPGLEAYGLEKVCQALGIPIVGRHRAQGDAYATLQLFKVLLQKDANKKILKMHLIDQGDLMRKERIDKLYMHVPKQAGVFYLHDESGEIIYMSKARNMRKWLKNILLGNSKRSRNIRNKSVETTFEVTGSYTLAQLKFNHEIHEIRPKYNYILPKQDAQEVSFEPVDILFFDKGREEGERSVLVVKDGKLRGYTYTRLDRQIYDEDILEHLLIPLEDNPENRKLVFRKWKRNRWEKVLVKDSKIE